MKKTLFFLLIFVGLGHTLEPVKSKYDFATTYKNVKSFLTHTNTPIFAEFDHSKNAKDVDMELNTTKVIVFGNPKVGTFLMQENPTISLELPLKVSIYEDNNHNVYVVYTDINDLTKKYKIKNQQVVKNINHFLQEMIKSCI